MSCMKCGRYGGDIYTVGCSICMSHTTGTVINSPPLTITAAILVQKLREFMDSEYSEDELTKHGKPMKKLFEHAEYLLLKPLEGK